MTFCSLAMTPRFCTSAARTPPMPRLPMFDSCTMSFCISTMQSAARPASITRSAILPIGLPDWERHALGQPLEDDPHPHAECHLLGAAADHVADEAWSLVDLDQHEHQRQQVVEGGQEGLVGHHVRVDAAAAARGEPLEPPAALPVQGLRRPVRAARRPLALQHEPALARAIPEGPHDRVVDVGERIVGMELGHGHSARSTTALVATPEAPVTSVARQPGTWLTDVPRIWRTPSRIRLNPCTYASESPPPEVSTGSSPPSSMRPPSVNGPPSPRRQKP